MSTRTLATRTSSRRTHVEPLEEDDRPPINCIDCKIGRVSAYGNTLCKSPEVIANCRQEIVEFKARQTILRAGKVPESLYTIYSGWACRYLDLSNRRRQILSFMIPGDVLALDSLIFPGAPLPFSVMAITPIWLCRFQPDKILTILNQSGSQRRETSALLQRYSSAMCSRLANIGQRSAAGRIAQLILEIATRLAKRNLAEDDNFDFPLRQEDIGDALGLTTEHVNRTLVELRKNRVIALARDELEILDRPALQQIADEE